MGDKTPSGIGYRSYSLQLIAKRFGQGLAVVAIAFLAWELHRQWDKLQNWHPTAGELGLLLVLTVLYGISLTALANNWRTIVISQVANRPPDKLILRSYTETQIAKYVPGNVMHLVGRHFYLKKAEVSHRTLAFATVLELISLPLAAMFAICLLLPFVELPDMSAWVQKTTVFLPVAAGVFFVVGLVGLIWRARYSVVWQTGLVLIRATAFMLAQGLVFAIILWIVSGEFLLVAVPLAVMAWLIGFATPGAPGGLGVREALLVTSLSFIMATENTLIAALLFRLVTTGGDLFLFGFGRVFLKLDASPLNPDGK